MNQTARFVQERLAQKFDEQFLGPPVPPKTSPRQTKRRKATLIASLTCPHSEVVWTKANHPRYGIKVPYFTSRVVPIMDCPCREEDLNE